MSIALFLTLFHIIGVALGVGGATVSDVLFFRALRDRRVSKDEFALLHTLGYILWTGLAILFVSGLGFVLSQLIATGTSSYLVADWFWAKMTIIAVLLGNAIVMHTKVFPFMKAHIDTRLNYSVVKPYVILLATTGVISITSWYSAMVLGVTRGLDFSYGYIINLYVFLVIVGILVAYMLFLISVFPKPISKAATVQPVSKKRIFIWVMATMLVGIMIVAAAWLVVDRDYGTIQPDVVTKK